MPLKIKAIIDVIKGTPLCHGSLAYTADENSLHCVMGELLHSLGVTNGELQQIDVIGHGITGYWNSPIVERHKPALAEKFGITSVSDMHRLVQLNDGFRVGNSEARTCYIMKALAKEYDNAAQN